MSRRSAANIASVFGLCLLVFVEAASAQDFVPGAEREITRDSEVPACVGEQRTPACAFEAVLYCMVRQDRQMCIKAGVSPDTYCRPTWITRIRYAIEQVYGADETYSWRPQLVPLSGGDRYARIISRVAVCVDGEPCGSPVVFEFGGAERRDGMWSAGGGIYEDQCSPPEPDGD